MHDKKRFWGVRELSNLPQVQAHSPAGYWISSNGVLQEECVSHSMPEVEQHEAAFSAALENTYTTTFTLSPADLGFNQ